MSKSVISAPLPSNPSFSSGSTTGLRWPMGIYIILQYLRGKRYKNSVGIQPSNLILPSLEKKSEYAYVTEALFIDHHIVETK